MSMPAMNTDLFALQPLRDLLDNALRNLRGVEASLDTCHGQLGAGVPPSNAAGPAPTLRDVAHEIGDLATRLVHSADRVANELRGSPKLEVAKAAR